MINRMLCSFDSSLFTAWKQMNENGVDILFITNNNRLIGVVTDGDIRRSLLNNISFTETVGNIITEDFMYARQADSYESMIAKISKNIKILPIINEEDEVIDIFECNINTFYPVAFPNLHGNEFKYLVDAFMSTWISSSGEYINRFEDQFSSFSDCKYGVAVSNGTVALHLALVALGIGENDEVIVPDLTFAATINTVLHARATPVIVDVEEDSWCIDPQGIIKAITPKTKAIIPVHLYGQACDMGVIMEIAKKYHLKVIEDCAEAHGAMYNGKKVGSFGDIGCFSFFGNKIITTGEGGMCITNDTKLDEKMRVLRDHGMSKTKRYWHDVVGYNYRMTNLQAAIGVAQLERIDIIQKSRRAYENGYKEVLSDKFFVFQKDFKNRKRITWLVNVLLDESINKEKYIEECKQRGIDVRAFFYPLSDMDLYKVYCSVDTPIAKMLSERGLSFPAYESLKSIDEIKKILKDNIYVQK